MALPLMAIIVLCYGFFLCPHLHLIPFLPLYIHVQLGLDIFEYRGEDHKDFLIHRGQRVHQSQYFLTPLGTPCLGASFQPSIASYRKPKKYEIIYNFSTHQLPFASKAVQD